MRLGIYCIILMGMSYCSIAQPTHFADQWLVGGNGISMIDFSNGTPVTDTFHTNNLITNNAIFNKGHSNICDSTGKIVLACNGYRLYDSMGNKVMGGDTLVDLALFYGEDSMSLFTQSSIILPMGNDMYYLIIPNASDNVYTNWYSNPLGFSTYFDQLLLYKIDIYGNNGLPKVVERVVLMDSVKMMRTMMMACKHANGKDWWLVKQMKDSSINMVVNNFPVSKNKIGKILIIDK